MTGARETGRVASAHQRALERLIQERRMLRPLGTATIALVVIASVASEPRPALHGVGLIVVLVLGVFATALAATIRQGFPARPIRVQFAVIAALAAAGVALTGLQPKGATLLGAGAGVFLAVVRLPERAGFALAGATTTAVAVVAAARGSSSSAVAAEALLCALLALAAYLLRQARAGQESTEVLLAQLEDARDEQARAAAVAERTRIAAELHDVLAHSLSAAAIQLQGARMLAEREQAQPQMRASIDRASQLVKAGLVNARQAVGALRGEMPGLTQLAALVESFRDDMALEVNLVVQGSARPLPVEAGVALYRGAQEALTNVARYAPRAHTTVVLRYDAECTRLTIENEASPGADQGLKDAGGGRGLVGMRERIERASGSMRAGPSNGGWRVQLEIPS